MAQVSEVTVKSWTQGDFSQLLASKAGLTLLVRDNDDNQIKEIQQAILSGGTDSGEQWSNTTTYNIGDVVISGGKFWESLQNNNTGNPPVEGSFWTEVVVSEANGFGRYSPGLYTVDPTVVINGDSLYVLSESVTLPFNSTDFAAELSAGDWVSAGGDTFNSIKFNPDYEPASTVEGEVYWNGKWHTIEYDTGLGATVKVGQTVYDVFYNDTGVTIQPFKVLHLKSAISFDGELYPTFELADASDYEKIQGTICISCCSVAPDSLGICVRDATQITGGDTSSLSAGSQLWVSDDGSGDLVSVKPEFPSASISVGGNYNQEAAPNGKIFVNITSNFGDIYHEAWDGSVIESFDFTVSSDGATITGLLENANPLLDLTLNFSDGTFRLDTTTSPLTIVLTPGTDGNEQTNYVYVPKSTKVLTLSTSGWPTAEHVRIAQMELSSAATTQADGGALGNQNINDHIKKEGDNGHILHIAAWIRKQFSTWESGTEATFVNTGGNGYINITGGIANQLHEQSLPAFSMPTESVRVWNDNGGLRPKINNLTSITAYSDGSTWNNEWSKIVVWRGVNKSGQYSPVNINLPSNGYNSEANALADALNYADYTIPNNYKSKAILVAAFTFRISGGAITYVSGYQDLRGTIPISVAGGGGGGGTGATTYLALTDTPNSRVGQAGNVLVANAAETAEEYEPKGWLFNAARTFKHIFVSNATANRTINFPDKNITVAGLSDTKDLQTSADLTSTAAADPGVGKVRFNNANQALVTAIYINETEFGSGNLKAFLEALSADSVIGFKALGNRAKNVTYKIGLPVNNTGWWTIPLSVQSIETAFVEGDVVGISLLGVGGAATISRKRQTLSVSTNNIALDWDSLNDLISSNRVSVSANATLTYVNSGNAEFCTFKVEITNLATLTFPSSSVSPDPNWSTLVWTPPANGKFTISIYKTGTEYEVIFTQTAAL